MHHNHFIFYKYQQLVFLFIFSFFLFSSSVYSDDSLLADSDNGLCPGQHLLTCEDSDGNIYEECSDSSSCSGGGGGAGTCEAPKCSGAWSENYPSCEGPDGPAVSISVLTNTCTTGSGKRKTTTTASATCYRCTAIGAACGNASGYLNDSDGGSYSYTAVGYNVNGQSVSCFTNSALTEEEPEVCMPYSEYSDTEVCIYSSDNERSGHKHISIELKRVGSDMSFQGKDCDLNLGLCRGYRVVIENEEQVTYNQISNSSGQLYYSDRLELNGNWSATLYNPKDQAQTLSVGLNEDGQLVIVSENQIDYDREIFEDAISQDFAYDSLIDHLSSEEIWK